VIGSDITLTREDSSTPVLANVNDCSRNILRVGPCGDRESKEHAFLDPRTLFSLNSRVWPPSIPRSVRCVGGAGFPTLLASNMFDDALVLDDMMANHAGLRSPSRCASHTPHTFQFCRVSRAPWPRGVDEPHEGTGLRPGPRTISGEVRGK
jgi:hypothetical protein